MQSFIDRDSKSGDKSPAKKDGSSFLNNIQSDDARTKSNLIQIPSISLPKGGGAIKSIDEKFSVNASNGTAALNIPIPFSPGRNNYTPPHVLSYDSGSGNGFLGLGWGIDIPFIQRKTEKKLPEYKDTINSDTFIFSGMEDLVPQLVKDADGNWVQRMSENNGITISYYRSRVEKGFTRIEHISENGNSYWCARTKENVVFVFGKKKEAKLYSPVPGEEHKIFKWCLEYTYDDKGSFVNYYYKKEDKSNVIACLPERNRLNDISPCTNIYIKGIQYGNKNAFYEGDSLPTDFLFELVFDYGEHDKENPSTKPAQAGNETVKWPLRKDPFSDYRAGFEIRYYRLCRRMLMFHHFKDELGWDDYLVRSVEFIHDEQPHCTYLEKITQTGYIWNTDGTLRSKKSFPPLEFAYFKPGFSREVREISPDVDSVVPGNRHYQWADLYSEGMPGILSELGSGWFYKENLGQGQFTPPLLVSYKPSFTGLTKGKLLLQELEGNGNKFIVNTDPVMRGYFEMDSDKSWKPFCPFDTYPNIDLEDPNLKFLDINGDGMPDMLISHQQEFVWYASKGRSGYDDPEVVAKANDEERGPRIVFQDKDEKMLVAIADMNGDGLSDIVLVTYAGVCYYPNLGYGRFGARVTLAMTGCFDSEVDFNPKYIHLADIDGSGTTDVVYTGRNKVQVWFNESGNNLSPAFDFFHPFPSIDSQSTISFVDLLGNGTSCMVWSSPLTAHTQSSIRYIDLMNGRKPHLLFRFTNNMGKEVSMEYRSSTSFYLEDKKKGEKWITRLPFPVQCVSKVIVEDKVSKTRFTNEYSYHHGYYDAIEREFRGFARVEQRDTEVYEHYIKEVQSSGAVNTIEKDLFQPAIITKTWFHTGAFINRGLIFQQLQEEYYPDALIRSGIITDPVIIATLQQYKLKETLLPSDLSATEMTECCRALKGLMLRQEIYSDEGDEQVRQHPYLLTQHNYDLQILQPKGDQKHAVFLPNEKETLTFHHERNPLDPRIAHNINIEIDQYGNTLQSAQIVYGRKNPDIHLPSDKDREKQSRQQIMYTLNRFTTIIDTSPAYRLPVLCETQTFELNTATPAKTFFTSDEIKQRFAEATTRLFEQEAALNEKRKMEHSRTLFLKNDLTGSMPLGTMDTLALPYENYLLTFTPTLLQNIYAGKFDESFWRNKGRYVRSEGDGDYWIRSGRQYFHPDLSADPFAISIPAATMADVNFAKQQFYLPAAHEDNFGNLTKSFYDTHRLFRKRTIDAKENETTVQAFNYRTLQPYLQQDANDNRTGVRFDELGRVTQSFVMGKETEFRGDPIDINSTETSGDDQPTAVYDYQFRYFDTNGQLPNRVKAGFREKHYYKDPPPDGSSGGFLNWLLNLFGGNNQPQIEPDVKWQEGYTYCDGSGNEVLKKAQAEPGLAPERDGQGNLVLDAFGRLQQKDTSPDLRWVGSGRKIVNNKGNTVKEYEPYFDSTPEYNNENELRQFGSTDIIFYDALGRKIRIVHANGSYAQVIVDTWTQKSYDENDTVQSSQWYLERINGAKGQAEQEAAQQAAIHHDTPDIACLDALGRSFLQVKHNKTRRNNEVIQEEFYYTRTDLDIEGNVRSITDARGNMVMTWKYDMLGNICYQQSMDGGQRWMLADARSKSLRIWDSRMQVSTYEYDELNRPLSLTINTITGDSVVEQCLYGEGVTDDRQKNLRGKLFNQFDKAGLLVNEAYDFKANLLATSRRLLSDYKNIPNWKNNPALETETFRSETFYDALNRPIQMVAPDGSVILQLYNEANLLNSIDVKIRGAGTATHFVTNIDYNARGQRDEIIFGNNTRTKYEYDPDTLRLTRLLSTSDNAILQDLNYTYDPAGNITRQFDNAQKTIFYGGQQVEAQSNYIYDALYRLVEANGREHTGQVGVNASDNFNDTWCRINLQPNSPVQLRNYTQKYFYDAAGNIARMQHIAGATGNWTRLYTYNPANNQLTKTAIGGQNYSYSYNEHGSMISMPHLSLIDWNFNEEVQHVDLGGGGNAWYVYDSKGQRLRKVIERGGNKTEERIYIGIFEVYRERTGNTITLERETLHIADDKQRIVMIDTRTKGNDGTIPQLIRYQYSDHVCSTSLELDADGKIISYEEYHPFGTTAFQATDASRQVPAKRYRYTGMERDEETGLNYHSSRYYVQWLGRWISCDPEGLKDGVNLYAYVRNNPIHYKDPTGTQSAPTDPDTSTPPPPSSGTTDSGTSPPGDTSTRPPGSGTPSNESLVDSEGKSDERKAQVFHGLNGLLTFIAAIALGALIGVLTGGVGLVAGLAIGAGVGFLQTLLSAAGSDPENRKSETYKIGLTISAWFNPMAWIGTLFGLVILAINFSLMVITLGLWKRARITDFRFYRGALVTGGGAIRPGRAWTNGNIIQYNPDEFSTLNPDEQDAVLRHEWGHTLNNAHFGLFQIESPLVVDLAGNPQSDSLFERLAESNVNPSRAMSPELNKDQRRVSGGRGFGTVPWWNP